METITLTLPPPDMAKIITEIVNATEDGEINPVEIDGDPVTRKHAVEIFRNLNVDLQLLRTPNITTNEMIAIMGRIRTDIAITFCCDDATAVWIKMMLDA